MENEGQLLQCYNRGCGERYQPTENNEDACRHHPGAPFFHDAYKGWSCCSKKCTDFTEFLNIKGCTVSQHSNVKPPEPEKPNIQEIASSKIVEVKPIVVSSLERPPFETPLILIEPEIAPSLKSQISSIEQLQSVKKIDSDEISIGTNCKNGGCTFSYQGVDSNNTLCLHHPGVPIFHEGLKYWSCCQRKTTDFNAFLNQEGCKKANHVWKKDDVSFKMETNAKVNCRWDYHQTGPYMIVSIYAKEYSPSKSVVQLNPIRLYVNLVFPQQNNANFELDIELKGIVDVSVCKVTMYGTKVEIKLKKAEALNWPRLEARIVKKTEPPKPDSQTNNLPIKLEAVDLSDL
uniref:Cysteine and histidine-rich domain-containing protein n=1 Tax=Dendroctonus ponderosae TaxID=77166 RepID=A0AAR5Q5P6_DENPD